jgi:transposase
VSIQKDKEENPKAVEKGTRLTEEQVEYLETLLRDEKTSVTIRKRAEILMALQKRFQMKRSYNQIALDLNIAVATVRNTNKRLNNLGFDQCMKYQRNANSNAASKLDKAQKEALLQLATSKPPEGSKKWTLRLLCAKAVEDKVFEQVSIETVRRVLKQAKSSIANKN